jgi:hypothetical protein
MTISIYDLLNKKSIDEITIAEFNSATENTKVDPTNLEYWKGLLTLSHVLKASRTYAHGLPIPLQSDVEVTSIANGASATVGPANNTEVWLINGIDLDNCQVAFSGDGGVGPIDLSSNTILGPIYLTRTLKLAFNNGSGSTQTPAVSYHKVSL